MAYRQTYKHTYVHMNKKQILKIKGTLSVKQKQSSEDKMLSHLCPEQEQGRRLFFSMRQCKSKEASKSGRVASVCSLEAKGWSAGNSLDGELGVKQNLCMDIRSSGQSYMPKKPNPGNKKSEKWGASIVSTKPLLQVHYKPSVKNREIHHQSKQSVITKLQW